MIMKCSLRYCFLLFCGFLAGSPFPHTMQGAEIASDHVTVTYQGIDKTYAEAIAHTVEAARDICRATFGFEMPQRIDVSVNLDAERRPRLFNDGVDQFRLTVRSARDLRKPTTSGVFHLYGMCHEVAHLGMYRAIPNHDWMTTAAAEGWAHYLGSRLVDGVYDREGPDLWPDRYDYRADGTKRLEKQLTGDELTPTHQGARLWRELAEILGEDKLPELFEAWGKVNVDPADPAAALLPKLQSISEDERVVDWWNRAESLFLIKRDKSGFVAENVPVGDLTGALLEVKYDDDKSVSKKSMAGGGHVIRFEKPSGEWFLTSVSIFGSRYGARRPPREDFHIWLCDEDFKVVSDFPIPYSKFPRGAPKWVHLKVKPTKIPPNFIICAGFNPSARKGVFVHYDAESSDHSFTGLPGRQPRPFAGGDWMIRVGLDQLKSADALGSQK